MKTNKYIFSGGGTGGHIFPAISLAKQIQIENPNAEILFIGSSGKMEMSKVPEYGFKIIGLPIDSFKRKISFSHLIFPLKLLISILKSLLILRSFKPNIVIGTGGYVSGPILFTAQILGYPTLIQEQNSYAGITNKLLSTRASKVAVAYPNMERFFPKNKIVFTGNPIRKEILKKTNKSKAKLHFNLDPNQPVIGITGGSLGAKRINSIIEKNLKFFNKLNVQILWQCGVLYYNIYKKNQNSKIKIIPFVKRVDYWYNSIDLLISRSGASTISEICSTCTPSILIPSPNVSENHQYHNAMLLHKEKASELIEEKDLENEFKSIIKKIWLSEKIKNEMKYKLKKLSKPNSTSEIINCIKDILN
ncbi:MAG: undecaprenyldiphospho-muramoylpentapeptide beta-N-acetylglucosaminyltransferase [Flavobacteriaceae bacterium TMED116]|nr:MAG: undecaprenyldiphospho-muramoylpentapeptide beta-N-acetylglucosaminyltransferase [Flavobacteriaceae bacterium TMED116]